MSIDEKICLIKPLDTSSMEEAGKRWNQVAKPLHSLGILEDDIVKIAGMRGSADFSLDRKALVIMCADNGIVEEGVTQTGQEVTAVVTKNITRGDSCVCIMAKQAGVDVFPVDIGVADDLEDLGSLHPLIRVKIAKGTRNFLKEKAMTRGEAEAAILAGIQIAENLKRKGYDLIATGEMGIGNTTTSSAVASVLLGRDPSEMTGKGAGLTDSGLEHKIRVIQNAVDRHRPDWKDGIDVLSKVGGLDLAGLAGIFLGGSICQIPVVVDGFISGAAALMAKSICPACTDYMLASHVSAEPAGRLILDVLGLKPVICGELCLGEGTGAVALVPLLSMAHEIYDKMSTFEEIAIESYKPL